MAQDDKNTLPAEAKGPELKADHTWYNSLFTQLLAPLFGFRYLFEAVEDINPKNFLDKNPPPPAMGEKPWKNQGFGRYNSFNFISHGMGALFAGITARYSANTFHDIKSVYAEAVGYELNKKPEEVTTNDIFVKSQNAALDVTRDAYIRRTLLRAATVATFFVPWHKFRAFQEVKPKYEANAKVGVGAIAAYIYAEGFIREPSFFDAEQKMVSGKINHKDVNSFATIQPQEVQSLLILQRKHINKKYQTPKAASQEGQQDMALSTRIADLLNQTYHNTPTHEEAHFTMGKLNFLIGFGLLDKFPESMAFVELANQSSDMSEVKQAAGALRAGQTAEVVFAQFGIDVNAVSRNAAPNIIEASIEPKFTQTIRPAQEKSFAPKTHQDYATPSVTNAQLAL